MKLNSTILILLSFFFCFYVRHARASLEIEESRPRPLPCRGNATGYASEEDVYQKYFAKLSSTSRPRFNSSESVLVSLKFSLSKISEVDERRRILKITGFLGVVGNPFV